MSIKDNAFLKVAAVSAGNMFSALLGFVFLVGVAKALPIEDFGKYALLTSLLTLLSRIIDFGTNSLYVSSNKASHNIEDNFILTKVLLFLLSLPISIAALFLLNLSQAQIVLTFIIGLVGYGLNYTLYAFYQKKQNYTQIIFLHALPAFIKGIYGVLLFTNIFSLNLIQSVAVFALSTFAGLAVALISPPYVPLKKTYSVSAAVKMVLTAFSAGVSQLINEGWQSVNNILTKAFNTYGDVGIFSMANKISNIFSLISYSVFTVLLPKNAERRNKQIAYNFKESILLGAVIMLLSMFAIVVAEIFLAKVFDEKFARSIKLLDLLIFASALSAVQNFLENYFYVHQQTSYLVKINGFKLSLLVVMSAVGIPIYGLHFLAVTNFIVAFFGLGTTYLTIIKLERYNS